MNEHDGFEAALRGQQKRRVLMAVAGGVAILLLVSVGLLVSALGQSSAEAPQAAASPDHQAMLKASIRAQRSALKGQAAKAAPAEKPAVVAKAEKPAPAPVAKAAPAKARKSSSKHVAANEESDLKRPSIADPVGPPPAKTVASVSSAGGTRGDEPADPN